MIRGSVRQAGTHTHTHTHTQTDTLITDRMVPYSTRRQIDIHETSKCNKNVWNFFISVTYCSKDNLPYKISYIRLITYYGVRYQCSRLILSLGDLWVIGRWNWVIRKLVTFAYAVLTVSSFFAGRNNSKHIFLSVILHVLFRATNSLFKNIRK